MIDDDTGCTATRKHNKHAKINGDIISMHSFLVSDLWSNNRCGEFTPTLKNKKITITDYDKEDPLTDRNIDWSNIENSCETIGTGTKSRRNITSNMQILTTILENDYTNSFQKCILMEANPEKWNNQILIRIPKTWHTIDKLNWNWNSPSS